jgi:hypothetical protein
MTGTSPVGCVGHIEGPWPSESKGVFFLLPWAAWEETMKKIDIASIPELKTSVGIHGSVKQKEVGGPVCIAILIGIFVVKAPDGDG